MSLTGYDHATIAMARELRVLRGIVAIRELTGDEDDLMAALVFIGRLQHHLGDLLAIIDREIGDGDG